MRMTVCDNGHYFDSEIHRGCPYCGLSIDEESSFKTMVYISDEKTQHVVRNNQTGTLVKDQLYEENERVNELDKDDIFDRYQVISKIYRGNFTNVYKVKHKYLDNFYALKTLNSNGMRNKKKFNEILIKEARRLSKLGHSNVVKIFDAGIFNKTPYILMEFLEEKRLDISLEEIEKFTVDKTFDLLEDIATVLVEQEKCNIIHGDIKPQNIFLKKFKFCLIDFSATQKGDFRSYTPKYASSEQLFDKTITHQSDLYSLGVTAYQCLTGENPEVFNEAYKNYISKSVEKTRKIRFNKIKSSLQFTTKNELKNKNAKSRVYNENIPSALEKILENLLAVDMSKRYLTAKDLLQDIQAYKYDGEEPTGAIMGSLFVAIAYRDIFESVFDTINFASKKMNFKCIRMDRKHFKDEIWKNIAMEIDEADVVIADFSENEIGCGANPNVITEASHARAKGKELILITQGNPEDLPFDWRYLPVIKYTHSDKGLIELAEKISHKLRVINNL